jgi:glutaredoxin-like protein
MPIISDESKKQVLEIFQKLTNKVVIHFFTQEFECQSCKLTHELLQELTGLSNPLELRVHDFQKDPEIVKQFEIDKIPAIVLEGQKVYGIRFFGIPSGYEFAALLEDLVDVSKGIAELSLDTVSQLNTLIKHLHIQVFTAPTYPYCPIMVRMAHKLALMSDLIKADMVASTEFPHLANKYSVLGVPKTIVNDGAVEIDGALPEPAFVQQVMRAA